MKNKKSVLALILVLAIIVSFTGCGNGGNNKYRVVEDIGSQSFCFSFRLGDKSGEAAIAAMKVLQADGTISELSKKWFGEDVSILEGDADALEKIDFENSSRVFLVGYDSGRMPFSGQDEKGAASGFDPDLARAVGELLGWRIKFVPIDVSATQVELNSGNVDAVCGGCAYDESNKKITQSPIYMENTIVIAALASGSIRNVGALSGKTLNVSENAAYNWALQENPSVSEKAGFVVRVPASTGECFKALDEGVCDAIVTDLAALEYFK